MSLAISELRAGYAGGDVLNGVSLTIERGEIVAVLGVNGAGKTTLFQVAMGLLPARAGTVRLDGEDITRAPVVDRVKRGLGLVPEGREVFSSLTTEENLVLGCYARHGGGRRRASRDLESVYESFPRLRERRRQLAGDLSGGEQQMLALGRALMGGPSCLIVDELSLGLAPGTVRQIYEQLAAAARERHLALCVVEQNTEIAFETASRAYVLANGSVAMSGASAELRGDERLVESYLHGPSATARSRIRTHAE